MAAAWATIAGWMRTVGQVTAVVMGRETAAQSHDRFSKAIESLKTKHADKNLAIVAHGTVRVANEFGLFGRNRAAGRAVPQAAGGAYAVRAITRITDSY